MHGSHILYGYSFKYDEMGSLSTDVHMVFV